jgi:putative cardiolipin synthase
MRAPRLLLLALLCILVGCAQLQPRNEIVDQFAFAAGESSSLDQALSQAEAQHAGQSAFRLLIEGPEAFAVRAQSARMAQRSLDVQTYIWHADLTGMFFAHELIVAADRGVRIRLLLDDLDARAKNAGFAALAAHPNIDVRLFNPFASRAGPIGFLSEGVRSFSRINRRMHNKSWIADNRVAIVGGRNVGDEYFGISFRAHG